MLCKPQILPVSDCHACLSAYPFLGLSLELNIEQEQYIGALTPEAGVRIHISDQGKMPFPLDKGLSLAPGYATSIGMRKVGSIPHLQVLRGVKISGL